MKFTKLQLFLLLALGVSFCTSTLKEPDKTADKLNLKRSCVTIREINWAGSVSNSGVYDADDDFIELFNQDCGIAMDLTGWRIKIRGQYEKTLFVPPGAKNIIQPANYLVIATKNNGAFSSAQIFMPDLTLPSRDFTIETKTSEDFLIENEINAREGIPLAGSYDGYTTRSMERTEDKFNDGGTIFTSWHSYTPCNEKTPDKIDIRGTACDSLAQGAGVSGNNVAAGYNQRTFASPGEVNTVEF